MMIFPTVFLVSFGVFSACQAVEGDTLRLVHVFFRHGSRTPEYKDTYPNDPFKADTFQPMGYGQLTNHGKAMAFKLGKNLRKRYDSFLGNIYNPDIVKATSTDFDRTKMSALLALAGLFQPSKSQQWNENLNWLPIPYEYEKEMRDYTLRRPNVYCPAYFKELQQVLHSEETLEFLKQHKKTLEYISENSGKPMNKLLDVFGIYQTLKAEDYMNLTLPEWTNKIYPEPVTEISAKQCELENSNTLLKKLNGGRMLSKVIKQMLQKSLGELKPLSRKIFLYSGHETNVINVLAALNLFETHFPNYSSSAIIELHYLGEEKGYFVKVYYARDVNEEPEEKKLEGCDTLCPLDKFIELTKPYVPKNYTEECRSEVYLD